MEIVTPLAHRLSAALLTLVLLWVAAPAAAAPGYQRGTNQAPTAGTEAPVVDYDIDVVLAVGDNFQQVVNANPPGTTYLVATGVHREQQVLARAGDTFVGQSGAVMSGARDLTAAGWTAAANGTWWIGGQTQQGFVHGTIAAGGNPRDLYPEELFVDGQRWTHVGSTAALQHGTWYFDYAADRIHLGTAPATLGIIETSTTSGAFGGTAVADVTIDNLIITHYASPAQHGAIGYFGQHHTHDWTIRNSTVIANHGAGIRIGPGMLVENSEIAGNGQIGLGGNGEDTSGGATDGYAAAVIIRGNDIHHNLELSYDWGWEGGAMKIKYTPAGSLVEGNWVHDNTGPGIWYDIDNRDAVIRDNLVEANSQAGIFYEISYGPTTIDNNVVRANGTAGVGDEGAGIDISNSTDVTVTGNQVYSNRRGILVRDDDRNPGLHRVVVNDNDVLLNTTEWTTKSRGIGPQEVTFSGNHYYGQDTTTFRADNQALTLQGWMATGLGINETLHPATAFTGGSSSLWTGAAGVR